MTGLIVIGVLVALGLVVAGALLWLLTHPLD